MCLLACAWNILRRWNTDPGSLESRGQAGKLPVFNQVLLAGLQAADEVKIFAWFKRGRSVLAVGFFSESLELWFL